jgi:G:T-mismatch repair DNA endonuclease (very short patch repair protein)
VFGINNSIKKGTNMILCTICNRNFIDRRSFGLHLSIGHRTVFTTDLEKEIFLVNTLFGGELVAKTVKEYKDQKWCIYGLPIDISKYILLLNIKRTSKQERSTTRYKQKYLTSIQKKYGDRITNISQVKEIQDKKENTFAKTYGSYDKYLAHQRLAMVSGFSEYKVDPQRRAITQSKNIATCIARYGVPNGVQTVDARAKIGAATKLLCSLLTEDELRARTANARLAVCSRGGYSSKPEKRVQKSLIDLNVTSTYNVHIWNYNWDMVIEKFLIEVQGTMWHAKPGLYKETDLIMGKLLAKDIWDKDARKHKKAREEGYTVIEIWEDEIAKCNNIELINLVKERLLENGYSFR